MYIERSLEWLNLTFGIPRIVSLPIFLLICLIVVFKVVIWWEGENKHNPYIDVHPPFC